MNTIIGLGNPGKKYYRTRHNVGFTAVDQLQRTINLPDFKLKKKFFSQVSEGKLNNSRIVLAKPQTYMNQSGQAVGAIAAYYKIKPSNIWIVYDDKDLPLGTLRIREKGGSAGHNGIESIIQHLGKKDFVRFRIGCAPSKKFTRATANFVLGKLNKAEQKVAKKIINQTVKAIMVALDKGVDEAINSCQISE